jgi:hypothetical protein
VDLVDDVKLVEGLADPAGGRGHLVHDLALTLLGETGALDGAPDRVDGVCGRAA